MEYQEKGEKGGKIFEKIMVKNFPNLMKNNLQIQQAQIFTRRTDTRVLHLDTS